MHCLHVLRMVVKDCAHQAGMELLGELVLHELELDEDVVLVPVVP